MDGESCLQLAYEAILQGDFESAASWFQRAIEADPDNASYYYKGSISLARNGRLAQAVAYADRALQLSPRDPVYSFHMRTLRAKVRMRDAEALLSQSPPKTSQAIEALQEAIRLDPLAGEAQLLLGIAYQFGGEYELSLTALTNAQRLNPQLEEAGRLLQEVRTARRRQWKQSYSTTTRRRNR
ncbi:tetratricopeptide repeat protein [Cohnella nanjingensis]|uniref:Tetratricopeptide repeat protein n=1 Tax=Cohnella nanjingensis TaxID=1387779 RepID=A0A7X0VHP1_9BACL|nr:tetratricopeptide repeat protein [Cohnella nanjingensis]MBB6674111.1 tetratricopeptide repeat protein [Cohnella nanjingensis]